jgi:8-oxo-dGTP pyrophosphatase MutT (NUDIX family)
MLFNEIFFRDDKNTLDLNNGNILLRNAVRAIIINENKILMVYVEKTDEYKFPGGGINENETKEEAVKREVLEEIGYKVKNIIKKIGIMTEYAKAYEGGNNIFKMISEYYLVEIENIQLNQNLDEYEKDLLYKACWVDMKKAYETNIKTIENNNELNPWIYRENIVLKKLINKYYNGI